MLVPTNIDEELVKEIDKLAKAQNRTRNNMIETLLYIAVEKIDASK